MVISELIQKLEEIKAVEGDLPVVYSDPMYVWDHDITKLDVRGNNQTGPTRKVAIS